MIELTMRYGDITNSSLDLSFSHNQGGYLYELTESVQAYLENFIVNGQIEVEDQSGDTSMGIPKDEIPYSFFQFKVDSDMFFDGEGLHSLLLVSEAFAPEIQWHSVGLIHALLLHKTGQMRVLYEKTAHPEYFVQMSEAQNMAVGGLYGLYKAGVPPVHHGIQGILDAIVPDTFMRSTHEELLQEQFRETYFL